MPTGGTPLPFRRKTLTSFFLLAVLLATAAGVYLFFDSRGHITSTSAHWDALPVEIRAPEDGLVAYAAKAGQPVSAGEIVLRLDATEYEKAAEAAITAINNQAGTADPGAWRLMLGYLSIPETEAELSEALSLAAVTEKKQKDAFEELAERQAIFGLELRRLEIKRNRLAEEEARMEAMRIEEGLLRVNMEEAGKLFEAASLERAAVEKRLETKRALGRALSSLPAAQLERLQALEVEFSKLAEAQRQMALTSVISPVNGKVTQARLAAGDTAARGSTALYVWPAEKPDAWITACFEPREADKISLGSSCLVTVGLENPFVLQGMIAERLPEQTGSGVVPFKIRLNDFDPEHFADLNPNQPIKVTLPN